MICLQKTQKTGYQTKSNLRVFFKSYQRKINNLVVTNNFFLDRLYLSFDTLIIITYDDE